MNTSAPRRSEASARAGSKIAPFALLLALSVLASPAWAAMVTTHEENLNTLIFNDLDFGSDTIEIRYNSVETLLNEDLLIGDQVIVDSGPDFSALKSAFNGLADNIIRLFFVDKVKHCGGSNGNFAGCAEIDGNDIVLNSANAANSSFGHVLIAHEIGHNLNLTHASAEGTPSNVMLETINTSNVDFLPAQIATIGLSDLIQYDGLGQSGQRFIEITPILVSAAHVPIPGAIVLFFSAIAALGTFGGKNRGRHVPA